MTDLDLLRSELEIHRRSLAMLPPGTPITREAALDVIARCQSVVAGVAAAQPTDHAASGRADSRRIT